MSQLASIAETLNNLADETQTTPNDFTKAITDAGDAFEKIVAELEAVKKLILADAWESADVVAAAQRLKSATDARVDAFKESIIDVVEARFRVVEAEHDTLAAAKLADIEAVQREKKATSVDSSHKGSSEVGQLPGLADGSVKP